ncbi:hypothetical protein Poli38472_000101 [Pythium oligandrum]|uniref:SH2 domain-containing protein n=1 Tax=Pythium oligandrum TaxID=41045 RepID=A0A8K1FGI9_PYTOL|nr:hypothetical protein Poli38472_000101 [Pythium oligandrum]|eukprot:TMW60059.1 hypothetical protein Poli38472_000101 [Pythium oligandrum]
MHESADQCAVCAETTVVDAHFAQMGSGDHESSAGAAVTAGHRFPESVLTYQRTSQLKIFLSYGHDRFQLLAFHLKHLLQQRGHTVWVDVEKLSAGIDWEEGIAGGLTWVKDAGPDGRVLLIMTPHALRRPDGYCLNEVARAASNRLSIFPVMVADSEPTPSISMLPYFDLRDCVPRDPAELALDGKSAEWKQLMKMHLHDKVFEDKAQRIVTVLELFDSMTAYGVPSVAYVENLGLFPSTDATRPHHHHHRDSRIANARRLLTLSSAESPHTMGSNPSSPVAAPHSNASDPGYSVGSAAKRDVLNGVTEETETEKDSDEEVEQIPHTVRYMFSFDDSCYLLAQRLYEDLSALGFSVYAPPPPPVPNDTESLQANIQAHEDALQWAAADKNGKMILLVTPESVGRPSGVSLNDISAAMAAGMGFVPLVVRQCEIPLSICRIQWLDMSDCLLYHQQAITTSISINEVRYTSRRDQLVTALKGRLDHEGQQARLFSLLSPLSFQLQISKLTQRFSGREWLFDAVRKWIDNPSGSQVFWVMGQMGSGKTSVAARMVETVPEIAAFHFALPEDEQTQNARRCVLSLAYQLTTQLPEYTVFLQSGEPLEEIVPVSSVQALVTHLLVKPLNAIARRQSSKPLLLLIDGLEHMVLSSVTSDGPPPLRPTFGGDADHDPSHECLVSLLPSLIKRLPSWVRVVLLSRDDHSIVTRLQVYTPTISIDRFREQNEQDIREFVKAAVGAPSDHDLFSNTVCTSAMRRHRMPTSSTGQSTSSPFGEIFTDDQVDLIAKRSEGLFLYAVNIVQSIEHGRLTSAQLNTLPIGMGGYLRQFFDSHFDATTYKTKIRPVLEVLCAAYEPLTMTMLASIFNWSTYDQHEITTSFSSLFSVTDDSEYVRPFHTSVLEWVQDIKTAGQFFADVAKGHERIGKWGAYEYDSVVQRKHNDFVKLNYELETSSSSRHRMHVYIVRHVCNHLMQAHGIECMQLVGNFASDESFQLARRLLSLRAEGLESFFHGDITRERSQELLVSNPRPGSFLIRYSARQKSYCTSFIDKIDPATGAPKFRHNLIYHLQSGAYSVLPPEQVTDRTLVFSDLVSFVEEYQRKGILKAAIPRLSPLNREISTSPYE